MPDKQGRILDDLPDEVFDGERYKVEIKETKCRHKLKLLDANNIRCKKCGVGWHGPQIFRLYEAYRSRDNKNT